MEKNLAELFSVLQQQIDCYKQLLELAREKRPVLVKGKIGELDSIVKKEEILIFEIGRLEEKRMAIHQALASHFALSAEELTISNLIDSLDAEKGQRLRNMQEEMSTVLKQITELNAVNSELIQSSLDYINFSLNLLTNDETAPRYDGQEETKRPAAAKIFDRKI